VKQRLQDDRTRVIRAQVFAEFHQKIREREMKIAGQELEIQQLKSQIKSASCELAKSPAKPRSSLLVCANRAEKEKLQTVLSGADGDVVLDTFILGASAQIYVINLVCVRKGEWLNSETINVYVMPLCQCFFVTFL
jgi:hypothetical protein